MAQLLFHSYPCSTAVNFYYYYICHYFIIHWQTCILLLFRRFYNETHLVCLVWWIFQQSHTSHWLFSQNHAAPVQGGTSSTTLRKLSRLVPIFFLLFEKSIPLMTFPNQLCWSWKQQLDWSRFRGQCSFPSFWKGLHRILIVTAGCQNHCNEQECWEDTVPV